MGLKDDAPRLWKYLAPDMAALVADGELLIQESTGSGMSDFSCLVFPFAKAYEGFLKKLFLDAGIIDERDYRSDHFRIGKVLSPNLARRLGARSAYAAISDRFSNQLAARLWHTWKEGRNLVFHYFPHNIRRLTRGEAIELVHTIVGTMNEAIAILKVA